MNERETYNERELAGLEEDLRKFGAPYGEPDPAYWASFRVRVMERVEKKNRFAIITGWITDHVLGSSLIGAGVAAAILLAMFGLPIAESSLHNSTNQIAEAPIAEAPIAHAPAIPPTVESPTVEQPNEKATQTVEQPGTHRVRIAASSEKRRPVPSTKHNDTNSDAPLLASVDVAPVLQAASETDYPVSLNELSDDELEFVYDGLRSLDSAE